MWHVRGPLDSDGAYVGFELVGDEGGVVPFEPWGNRDRDIVAKLVDKHGTSLHGVFKCPSFNRMQLYIDEIAIECD